MIEPKEVSRLGLGLAESVAKYSSADLEKILYFAYQNRIKGGSLSRLATILAKFALEIQAPRTARTRVRTKPRKARRQSLALR